MLVAGHIGVGHVHSYGGTIQDDSLGFTSVLALIRKFYDFDSEVRKISVESLGKVCVETAGGGVGCAYPRRGMTEFEAEMLKNLEGTDASLPHLSVLRVFGRMYGSGCSEVPVAVEYALAEAALETLGRAVPNFTVARSSGSDDLFGGVAIELEDGLLVALATVNGSRSGTGPVEDLEGNVPLGPKKTIMDSLGVLRVPTVVLESKAYVPHLSDSISGELVLLRYDKEYDNPVVAKAVAESLEHLGVAFLELDRAFPRYAGSVKEAKKRVAIQLSSALERLSSATTAVDKGEVVAHMARIVCEDLGGVLFMSDDLAEIVGSAGLVPGTGAVASIAVGSDYLKARGLPYATLEDSLLLAEVALKSSRIVLANYEEALRVLNERYVEPPV